MSLVPSLFQAILRVDGDALVMHPGDKPYVVASTGQVELASRGLTLEAVNGIVSQLLPPELQRALEEFIPFAHDCFYKAMKVTDCTRVAVIGREGWKKVLKPFGFRHSHSVFVKDISPPREN